MAATITLLYEITEEVEVEGGSDSVVRTVGHVTRVSRDFPEPTEFIRLHNETGTYLWSGDLDDVNDTIPEDDPRWELEE